MTQTQQEVANAAPDFPEELSENEQPGQTTGSTLIEFPGARNVPQWRKELSERVREIQQRRAREAVLEEEAAGQAQTPRGQDVLKTEQEEQTAARLGLVPPPPEAPELNPIVAAALKRLERARRPEPNPTSRHTGGVRAATAVARAPQTRPEAHTQRKPATIPLEDQLPRDARETNPAEEPKQQTETARASGLVAVAPPTQAAPPSVETITPKPSVAEAQIPLKDMPEPAARVSATVAETVITETVQPAQAQTFETIPDEKPKPRRVVEGVVDDAWLSRLEERILPPVAKAVRKADDTAPLMPRLAAGLIDLLIVAFISSPFAAVIELTNGNWSDPRVAASMGGVVLVLMFTYLTVSTALAGRTFGMSFFRLHTVDAETALAPRLGQCVRRSFVYMLSLATFGIGLLYALFDAERRTAHDHLSGTVVVREII